MTNENIFENMVEGIKTLTFAGIGFGFLFLGGGGGLLSKSAGIGGLGVRSKVVCFIYESRRETNSGIEKSKKH